jgi:hypothetical protein
MALAVAALAGCRGELKWYTDCGGCGFLPTPPDGGWGPGSCTSQIVGARCGDAGESCTRSADPCTPALTCTDTDPTNNCGPPRP